MPEVFCQYYC